VRSFRGATYLVAVSKPEGVAARVTRLVVDGKDVEGNLVPLAKAGSTVEVEAIAL
jgi:cellobiose phosphorylase